MFTPAALLGRPTTAAGDAVIDMMQFTASSESPAHVGGDAVATAEVFVLIGGLSPRPDRWSN